MQHKLDQHKECSNESFYMRSLLADFIGYEIEMKVCSTETNIYEISENLTQ